MFEPTKGSARELIDSSEAAKLPADVLVTTDDRRRPLYFDGRFLTASALVQEQTYYLSRQADLGRAGGFGVVHGLQVSEGDLNSSIRIEAGHGITPLGEIAVLSEDRQVDLTDVPEIQRLDASFGLLEIPSDPNRNLTGLYIVALRPVEYTANPIASYPTSIDGKRSTEDGDIIEAVAITLIPYRDVAAAQELHERRSLVARRLFVENGQAGLPAGALPLAMIAVTGNVLDWVDNFMVRREVGAEHGDVLGLGFAPRALREAHVLQYHRHLDEILEQRRNADEPANFSAADYFRALPPAGRMPVDAVDSSNFTQIYFPVGVDVDLSIIPEDEVAALVEESLLLPPIDLTLSVEELASTSVLVLIPIPRQRLRALSHTLESLSRRILPAAPGLVARTTPYQALKQLKISLPTPSILPAQNSADVEWQSVLAEAKTLWYMRRRNLQYKAEVVAMGIEMVGDEFEEENNLTTRLRSMQLTTRFGNLKRRGSAAADAEMVATLASPKFEVSKTLVDGVIREFEVQERIDRGAVLKVAERFADPQLGEGISRLEGANTTLTNANVMRTLASSGKVPELDRLARLTTTANLPTLAGDLATLAGAGDAKEVAAFVDTELRKIQP